MSKDKKTGSVSIRLTTEPLNDAERKITDLGNDLSETDMAALAYELWQARGCPDGSPDENWFQAIELLRARK